MNSVQVRLQVMMFLQFFVWGAWFATLGLCLGMNGLKDIIGESYGSAPIAAIIAPLFLGLIADRFFASEKVMGVLFLLGGAIMCAVPHFAAAGNSKVVVWLFIAHMLCYMPTLGLSNTIAFTNIADQSHFPRIRVWGTIGWIVAGLVVGVSNWSASFNIFWLAAISSIVLGAFSFMLPHTPPPAKGKPADLRTIFMVDAFKMLANPSFAVFMLCSMLVCIPLGYYYSFASNYLGQLGFQAVGATLTLGQMSEIVFMLLIPFFFRHLGVKWMILIGMAAWVGRYLLFAYGAPNQTLWMILLALLLHGICYDFFFVTGFMYTDKKAPKEIRGQAQSLLVFFTQGIGLFFGFWLAKSRFKGTVTEYARLVLDSKVTNAESLLASATDGARVAELQQAIDKADAAIAANAPELLQNATDKAKETATELLTSATDTLGSVVDGFPSVEAPSFLSQFGQMFSMSLPEGLDQTLLAETMAQWKEYWILPAIMAGAVLVIFALFFHDKVGEPEASENDDK